MVTQMLQKEQLIKMCGHIFVRLWNLYQNGVLIIKDGDILISGEFAWQMHSQQGISPELLPEIIDHCLHIKEQL